MIEQRIQEREAYEQSVGKSLLADEQKIEQGRANKEKSEQSFKRTVKTHGDTQETIIQLPRQQSVVVRPEGVGPSTVSKTASSIHPKYPKAISMFVDVPRNPDTDCLTAINLAVRLSKNFDAFSVYGKGRDARGARCKGDVAPATKRMSISNSLAIVLPVFDLAQLGSMSSDLSMIMRSGACVIAPESFNKNGMFRNDKEILLYNNVFQCVE